MSEENKVTWTNEEIDSHVDELVQKALKALDDFETFNQEQVDYIVAKCSVAGLDQHGVLAEAAVKETGRGVFEDKAVKNLFACEYVTNNLRHLGAGEEVSKTAPMWSISMATMAMVFSELPDRLFD